MPSYLSDAALAQHIAVVGKTGSGKTSTAKLIVEEVVPKGARVCILDPIKSDWWGLTSSRSGKKAGLPFYILGGPRGHVPLHESSGKAIGELVATGKLPLSIIDMADFKAGGLQRFFIAFAEALFKKMKGIVYLVIEEAHEFAPKERANVGDENLMIYWAKRLATASRTKGIRLILVTQRTQSLHNALLGSCDTVIAHRLTLPADQKPIVDWLKAHLAKDKVEQATRALASLKTGTGIVAGETGVNVIDFPEIGTYDNSATPTDDIDAAEVETAAVDQDALRAIIGDAVKEAEANDPKKLREQITALSHQLAESHLAASRAKQIASTPAPPDHAALQERYNKGLVDGQMRVLLRVHDLPGHMTRALDSARGQLDILAGHIATFHGELKTPIDGGVVHNPDLNVSVGLMAEKDRKPPEGAVVLRARIGSVQAAGSHMSKAERAILTALAQHGICYKTKVAALTGYAHTGGGFNNALGALRSKGWIAAGDPVHPTDEGLQALGPWEPLPRGQGLYEHWKNQLSKAEAAAFQVIYRAYPKAISKAEVAREAGYEAGGGGFNNALGRLRTLGIIERGDPIKASKDLFV